MPPPTQSEGQSQGPSSPAPVSTELSHQLCGKGKKRPWLEQDSGSYHQISSSKLENNSSKSQKCEHSTKLEDVYSVIEIKGGMDSQSKVEQLVLLMRQHSNKSPELIRKIAGVLAATEQGNCLNHFVHMGGLSSLNEWLQDACKGKVVESDNVKEEFIIELLNVLEILPINCEALKACNIRKSVKHLCNHKNSDIQRKAKYLVQNWKKQVDLEMKANETKGEFNRETDPAHFGESGLVQEVPNSKYAVNGVLEPPDPAPSMLNILPPFSCDLMTRMASLVHIIEPIRFVETICSQCKRRHACHFTSKLICILI